MFKRKRFLCGVAAALIISFCMLSFTACNSGQYYIFNTNLEISTEGIGGDKLKKAVYESISRNGDFVTPTLEGSDVYKINRSEVGIPVLCSDVTMAIMAIAENAYDLSGGAYDPTVYPLVRLWGLAGDQFTGGNKEPPFDEEIQAALALVGLKNTDGTYKAFSVDYENKTITRLIDGSMLDFGGAAKGYFVDEAKELANSKQNIMVNLGGNIAVRNRSYKIGIANPVREDRPKYNNQYDKIVTIESGECISTSGDYERFYTFTQNDVKTYYHHILNPFTGYPSDNSSADGLVSATVICADGGLGDALSTAVMALGKTKGVELLRSLGLSGVIIDSSLSLSEIPSRS